MLRKIFFFGGLIVAFVIPTFESKAQDHSVAREWNEMLLTSIRNDFARPTVHARNLFQISAAMYDAWAVFNSGQASPYLLGNNLNGFSSFFSGYTPAATVDVEAQMETAISYAAYRMLMQRFAFSPAGQTLLDQITNLMTSLGHDPDFTSVDFSAGSAAALGNYIALQYLSYGLDDGSHEEFDFANFYYQPVNEPLEPEKPGNPDITDLNRWQPLALTTFIDQSGNPIATAPRFLSPEWGNVYGFSLTDDDKLTFQRDGNDYHVYNDPGMPPLIEEEVSSGENDYHWGFELVAIWGSHLDPSDGVMWDISPGNSGNISELPTTFAAFRSFYNEEDGGDPGQGRATNPKTGEPYAPNMVPRGDYARVLAEFWADGPDSETPPGHWFTILNYVSDHEQVIKKFKGEGETLSDLEWDIKAYFVLGGAMHDSAISAWGIKGWYDYIRPVSAIRAMADLGQSSNPALPNYHVNGITLKAGFIEMVEAGDPLAGPGNEHVGKVKLYTWKGPDYIDEPETDEAGVDWILAENWWPYQRPTFVTPPFAGYISGHSTFSRAAAEVLTLLTGDEYFPGGMGEFEAPKNEFLVFEEGPSVDVTLQWATYRDASDQTSLSRIWGGIHPPADDIPGRIIGEKIGVQAFVHAETYFEGNLVTGIEESIAFDGLSFGPNPAAAGETVHITVPAFKGALNVRLIDPAGVKISETALMPDNNRIDISTLGLNPGLYLIHLKDQERSGVLKLMITN